MKIKTFFLATDGRWSEVGKERVASRHAERSFTRY